MDKIPVSVLITTKNEERNIARCLAPLQDFAQIMVIDSHSADKTAEIAQKCGAEVVLYTWDGKYPKKRQWCLDNLDIAHDWVFWVDADEVVTDALVDEIRGVFHAPPEEGGFFVPGRYVWQGRILKHGLYNNKIALMNRHKMEFPVVNDLDIEGMGEIEGHYQPVFKYKNKNEKIGQIRSNLLHYAYEHEENWDERHERYAHWEAEMARRECWPVDPVAWREMMKRTLRRNALKPTIVFLFSYFLKLGFLDGRAGFEFAQSRKRYCSLVFRKMVS